MDSFNRPLDARATGTMVLLCALWSLQQISLKAAIDHASPLLMVALRSGIALALLMLLMRHRGDRLGPGRWKPGMVVGALFALEFLLATEALRHTGASHVIVFLYTAPLFSALGLHLRLPAERLGPQQALGMAVAFGGLALAFLGGDGLAATASGRQVLLGDLLALLAGMAWGATTVALRCTSLATAPATETLFYQLLGAFALLLPTAWLTGQWRFDPMMATWAHLGFQGVAVSFASFLVWFWLLRHYLASRLGVLAFLTPVFGVVLGAVLLGERLEPPFLAGSGLILVGIALVTGPQRVRMRRHA